MCGIVAAVGTRNVVPILMEGLRRLEYRGYDSAGLAVQHSQAALETVRAVGKVAVLASAVERAKTHGVCGIAHTRWATHGGVSEANAHPQTVADQLAVVHNGIIENDVELREELQAQGATFHSQTDTEVVAHLIAGALETEVDLHAAVRAAVARLRGAFAIAVMSAKAPQQLVCARMGSPLVIGLGVGEHFAASDAQALLPVTQRFVYLQDGDTAELTAENLRIFDCDKQLVERPAKELAVLIDASDKGGYRH
jgi:glucosamine--fructose-6-phosphate aminotransferase (isomerizing)